jgi:hypothetical protein
MSDVTHIAEVVGVRDASALSAGNRFLDAQLGLELLVAVLSQLLHALHLGCTKGFTGGGGVWW